MLCSLHFLFDFLAGPGDLVPKAWNGSRGHRSDPAHQATALQSALHSVIGSVIFAGNFTERHRSVRPRWTEDQSEHGQTQCMVARTRIWGYAASKLLILEGLLVPLRGGQ